MTFKLSNNPQPVEKVRDIFGLYLDPPTHVAVFRVDEKPQIQRWSGRSPCCRCYPGRPSGGRRLHAPWDYDLVRRAQREDQ